MNVLNRIGLMAFALLVQSVALADCNTAAHRAFDFWIGHWQVKTSDGKVAGTNRIQREYGGCVLHERYTTDRGYTGESLNIYDSARKIWHQTWVDSDGLLLVLEGGVHDGKMVLEGKTVGADSKVTQHRITWTSNRDGTVRQYWESTDDKGAWVVAFDGLYARQ